MIVTKEIQQDWFGEHKATLTSYANIQVLDWRKPGTGIFALRYVFDGCHMSVVGDLGEAIFRFSERADIHTIAGYSLDYFEEKMRAFTDCRRDFNQEKAKQYLAEQKVDHTNPDEDAYAELLRMIDDCSSIREWEIQLAGFDFTRVGSEAWEWLPCLGDEIPIRVKAYLIGLKMASKQVKSEFEQGG